MTPSDRLILGAKGLALVVPIAALLALGAGGAERSVLIFAPLVTYALPAVAMVAFWWEDWPGTRLRPSWSGWADTLLVAVAAVALTAAGQTLAGGFDLRGIFDPTPGAGHVPTFPATMPLAGAAFIAMLQLTLVGEGWPLRDRMPNVPAGLIALAAAWAVALVVWALLPAVPAPPGSDVSARHGPIAGADLGAVLAVIGGWQVLLFVLWRGWPLTAIGPRAPRLAAAHGVTLGGGIATYLALHGALGVGSLPLAAATGCFVGAALVVAMQFDARGRWSGLAATTALTAVLLAGLRAAAAAMPFHHVAADDWVEHAGFNAIAVSALLHVAVGRRWPFGGERSPTGGERAGRADRRSARTARGTRRARAPRSPA